MIPKSLTIFMQLANDSWRDRILTGLTPLIVLDLFVVAPLGATHEVNVRPFGIALVVLLAVGLLVVSRSLVPVVGIVAAMGIFISTLILHARGGHDGLDICLEAMGRLLVGAVVIWVVARAVFAAGRVTYHRVIGAVLLYLGIGFLFVAFFSLADMLFPGSFTGMSAVDDLTLPSDFVYFSFTILTTVGFGDIVPVHPLARSLCNVEAIVGQLYPATLLAYLVSLEVASRR
jgi:Ion channel